MPWGDPEAKAAATPMGPHQTRVELQLAAFLALAYFAGGLDVKVALALMPLLLRGLVLVWVYNLGNTHDSVVEIDVPGIGPWISGGVEAALMLANLVGFVLVTVFVDLFGGFVCGALSLVSWIPGFPEPGGCKVER